MKKRQYYLVPALLFTFVAPAGAQEADLALGRRLIAENNCNGTCHQAKVAGADPSTLFTRATRRVNSRDELRHQVEICISRLDAGIFPEDIESIVVALDHDFYHLD